MTYKCNNCGEELGIEEALCPFCYPDGNYDEDQQKLYICFDEEQCI